MTFKYETNSKKLKIKQQTIAEQTATDQCQICFAFKILKAPKTIKCSLSRKVVGNINKGNKYLQ